MPTPNTVLMTTAMTATHDGEPERVDDVGVVEDRRAGRSSPSAKVFLTTSDTGQATSKNR